MTQKDKQTTHSTKKTENNIQKLKLYFSKNKVKK